MTDRERRLLTSLIACREACCAAMRVITEIDAGTLRGKPADTATKRFIEEAARVGVTNGFGKVADDLIRELRRAGGSTGNSPPRGGLAETHGGD